MQRLSRNISKAKTNKFIIFLSLCLLCVFVNTVYSNSETVLQNLRATDFFSKMFPFFMGGGVFGVFIRTVQRKYLFFKRIFDLVFAITCLIIAFPLFVIIAFLIKIDSQGSVFFQQVRLGKEGKPFKILKFRTMRMNAELETGPVWADEDDPRITMIGRFLRKAHLDEIPQLINVLRGEMSLIGPRPERPEFTELITKHIKHFPKRLSVKPGITGLAQVKYRYGASIQDAGKKLRYDLLYIKRKCWVLDFVIIFWTCGRFLSGEGAR